MARKKSINDLRAQRDRILNELEDRRLHLRYPNDGYAFMHSKEDAERGDKVLGIFGRYEQNILNKSKSNDWNRKYSQSTYMGTANG